jgi:protein-S-isoprenylcysteine O-methyltransferase Ste14
MRNTPRWADQFGVAVVSGHRHQVRLGVIAREEAYLERKFGNMYLSYKSPRPTLAMMLLEAAAAWA